MSGVRSLLRLPGRWLVPLFLLLFALLTLTLRYSHQMQTLDQEVGWQEQRRLMERLSVEQTRLDVQTGMGNMLLVRRLVGGLALHQGITRAYLVGADGQVEASLSRLDIGQPLTSVFARAEVPPAVLQALSPERMLPAMVVQRAEGLPLLTALVPVQMNRRLLVVADLSYPLAQRRASVQAEVANEGALMLAAAGLLAALLHLLWFRRAQRLAQSLSEMGAGNFAARTGLKGGDELALIGEAADRMAGQLQIGQDRLRRMTDIINRSPLVVIEWRNAPGWPVNFVSESVAQWGHAPADLLSGQLHYADLIHPDDVARITDEVTHYLAHGPDEYRQEYRIRCADGRWAWVDDRTSLTRDGAGEVESISGILLDITARKEAELAQLEQAELLRMFYELPFLGMAISSPTDKRWLQVNDRLCEILGYSRDELLRLTWAEITPPGDLERNVELFNELLAGQRSGYRMAKRFVRRDGGIVHAEIDVRCVRDAGGRVTRLFATIQDVTDRKQAEAALRTQEMQLREAQRIGRMGSWDFDIETGHVNWSEEVYRIHEADPAQFQPSFGAFLDRVHPEDQERVRATYQRSLDQRTVYATTCRLALPGGRIKHLRVRGETEWQADRPVRTVGMVMDETDLIEAQVARDRLATVMEATSDIVSMADPQGQVFYFNRAGYQMLGLPLDRPLGSVIPNVHPDWAVKRVLEEGIPTAIAKGRWLGETAVLNAQGAEVPMSQLIMAHHDAQGQIDYVWTILRDISERKAAEAALWLERSRLAEAQAVARIGSWSVQIPSGEVSWSAHRYAVLGLDPQRVTPTMEAHLSVVHPDDLARVRAHIERVVDHQVAGVAKVEHRIITPQGVRHVEERGSVERDAAGRVVRLYGTTMDITDRVLASQALREAKDMLEQGEAVVSMGSLSYDCVTGVLTWSRQAFATIGLPWAPQPPTIDEYCACIHPDDVGLLRESIGLLMEGAQVPEVRFRTHPDRGPVRWLRRVHKRIDRSAMGLKPRYIGTLQDITEAVQAEEKLRQINLQLEQRVAERTAQLSVANRELEAFSYTVSHDLKAPLRGIDGYSQLLVEEYGSRLDDDGREFVQRIRQGVRQMGELINDLLEYSRMERRDMAVEPVALQPLVEKILNGYHADIQKQGAQVHLSMEAMTLALDREGMSVVLRNLIGNALKFSRESHPSAIEIGARTDAGRRILWVRDNGVGFDMQYHDRMFGIFQRLHRAEDYPGTGVGLALVAKAVQRMGGRVWAESTLGVGATFYLEFPE